jgi:hypothetical protein
MLKIVVFLNAGLVGTDAYEFFEVSDDRTHSDLDDLCWQLALDHAESYGIYNRSDYADSEVDVDSSDEYSDNIDGYWEIYKSEDHDCYTVDGTPQWQYY